MRSRIGLLLGLVIVAGPSWAETGVHLTMIDVLVDEGYEWTIIPNSHLSRTCPNYQDSVPNLMNEAARKGYRAVGFDGNPPYASDFHIWSHVYDRSGVSNVTLFVRTDADGANVGFHPMSLTGIASA